MTQNSHHLLAYTTQLGHPICMDWTVYIIRCTDESLYTGVTTDLERRFAEHLGQARGARYFNGREPKEIVFAEKGHTRSSACQREACIKKLKRNEKLRLIAGAG